MLYGKETLILEEAMSTLLSNEIRKRPNQDEQNDQIWWLRDEKEEKKERKLQACQRRVTFVTRKVIERTNASIGKEWLKKKGQAEETNVASGDEVLMAYYVEDNTFQDKSWIFDSGTTVHVCS